MVFIAFCKSEPLLLKAIKKTLGDLVFGKLQFYHGKTSISEGFSTLRATLRNVARFKKGLKDMVFIAFRENYIFLSSQVRKHLPLSFY